MKTLISSLASLLVFAGLIVSASTSFAAVVPYVYNESGSTLCYSSGGNWGAYNVIPKYAGWPQKTNPPTSAWISYNVRGSSTGDCSTTTQYQGNVTLSFNADGSQSKAPVISNSGGYSIKITVVPNDWCKQSASNTAIQCYQFTIN